MDTADAPEITTQCLDRRINSLHSQLGHQEHLIRSVQCRLRERDVAAEFGHSTVRAITLALATYIVLAFYMTIVSLPRPWINALVPAVGFQISTWTLPRVEKWYSTLRVDREMTAPLLNNEDNL